MLVSDMRFTFVIDAITGEREEIWVPAPDSPPPGDIRWTEPEAWAWWLALSGPRYRYLTEEEADTFHEVAIGFADIHFQGRAIVAGGFSFESDGTIHRIGRDEQEEFAVTEYAFSFFFTDETGRIAQVTIAVPTGQLISIRTYDVNNEYHVGILEEFFGMGNWRNLVL